MIDECTECGCKEMRVHNTKRYPRGIARYRACLNCGHQQKSVEITGEYFEQLAGLLREPEGTFEWRTVANGVLLFRKGKLVQLYDMDEAQREEWARRNDEWAVTQGGNIV